jgi:hypothetical protein
METNSKKYKFIIFCLEHYRNFRHITAMQALSLFSLTGVFHYLSDGYDVLHTQSRDYIVTDIDNFINNHIVK